ncbi:histidine--tRNA ligase [Planctomycetota bacterium]
MPVLRRNRFKFQQDVNMSLKAPVGTQDILPDDVRIWRYVEDTARRVFQDYAYREIRTPIFEEEGLFNRSIGETTDIVEKEMYGLTTKSGPTSFVLRPELTASVVRAYLEHNLHKDKKFQKLYYLGPLFRHERPQKGRSRQFHQIGVEALGSYDPLVDVEIMHLALAFFDELGIENATLKVNSIGCLKCRDAYRTVLKEKLGKVKSDLCDKCRGRFDRNVFRILDCKNNKCCTTIKCLPPIQSYLCADCKNHFETVETALRHNGINYKLDHHLVRGFDYYTKTVFEITHDSLGSQNALCGGGRYDNLVAELGGPAMGATGFAIGTERTVMALSSGRADEQSCALVNTFVVAVDDTVRSECFKLVRELRQQNISADMDYEGKSLKAQMRLADRLKAKYVVVLGPQEIKQGIVRIKDMADGQEKELKRLEVIKYFKSKD